MMRNLVTCLAVLMLVLLTTVRSDAASGGIAGKQLQNNTAELSNHARIVTQTAAKSIKPYPGNSKNPYSDPGGSKIKQAPDAAMHASVVPATHSLFALIAILHLSVESGRAPTVILPPQNQFHKILFRAIISPNAP
jgi:hypothetical protein